MKLYQHFKGGLYAVKSFVVKDATGSRNGGRSGSFVLYESLETEETYIRRYDEFHEKVEHKGKTGPRFRFIADPADIMPEGGHP